MWCDAGGDCKLRCLSKGGIVIKYYYEYKEKSGSKVGGSNLEKIEFYDNYIRLSGLDTLSMNTGYKKRILESTNRHETYRIFKNMVYVR